MLLPDKPRKTDSTITKLCVMTEEDFAELELYPDFDP